MKIKICIVLIFIFFFEYLEAYKPSISNVPDDLKKLNYRVSNFVYKEADLLAINKYTQIFLTASNKKDAATKIEPTYIFLNSISLVQLPKKQISLLNRYAVALSGYEFAKKHMSHLNDIIWWSEARQIEDENDLATFLNNQMLSNNWKKALKMFVEKGMTEEISIWPNKIKNSELLFEMSIRKAKVRKLFIENPPNMFKLLKEEIKLSITEVLPIIKKKGSLRARHLIWLIKQLGVYRQQDEINEILLNLVEDDFYYNKDIYNIRPLDQLSIKDRIDYEIVVKERLIISTRAKEALNPFEMIKPGFLE